jgi:hypothetical protein
MSAIVVHHFYFLFIYLFLWSIFGVTNTWANTPPLPPKDLNVCENSCGTQIKCSESCQRQCPKLCSQKKCEKEKGEDCKKEKQSEKDGAQN